ncbi:MAG: V-type ATP synthase subunit D [Treponema sp.]|nr:V-type ATP synthase subunit D [Treponema sp.]
MAKIKLTKNELKKQKDSLKMFQRYLPTLVLKKQQLQGEIRLTELRLKELETEKKIAFESIKTWIAVFAEKNIFTADMLSVSQFKTSLGNIAGVAIPVFDGAEFTVSPYDLARTPLWLDQAVEKLKHLLLLDLETMVVDKQRKLLDRELRLTTQRVNLFEKVKIPETKGHIKKIQVYLGDQQTSAVVRGKIAKSGLEKAKK